MATVNLYPDGTTTNSFTLSTGSDAHTLLQDDASTLAGDSNYLSTTSVGRDCYLTLDNFTEAHSSIDGVQIVLRAGNGVRSQTYDIETQLLPGGIGTYYTESTGTENANRYYLTHTFTNRTTTDGSTAWNNTLIDALRLYVKLDALSGGTFAFTQAYVIVTYTEPVATDNSIFFGCNF
jgi:hypothetical protein